MPSMAVSNSGLVDEGEGHTGKASNDRVFLPQLDSIRTLAFLAVYLHHGLASAFRLWMGVSLPLDLAIHALFESGGTGVQVFFVLSGFLITYLLLLERQRTGTVNLPLFYVRRGLRIWPLYYAVFVFGFVLYPWLKASVFHMAEYGARNPLPYALFLANFDVIQIRLDHPGEGVMHTSILWSVSIEEQFYLAWPLLLSLVSSSKQWLVPLGVLFACLGFRVFGLEASSDSPASYFHTLAVAGDLAIGGLFAYLMVHVPRARTALAGLGKSTGFVLYAVIAGLYVARDFLVFPLSGALLRLIFDFLWAFLICHQCFSPNRPFDLARLRVLAGLGKYTYGLYLLHPIALLIMSTGVRLLKVDPTGKFFPNLFMGVTGLFLSLALAKLSYDWLEKPFLKRKELFAVIKSGAGAAR
jgi:peptidoglycan/LPS O-acetylase OafA/YrhL